MLLAVEGRALIFQGVALRLTDDILYVHRS